MNLLAYASTFDTAKQTCVRLSMLGWGAGFPLPGPILHFLCPPYSAHSPSPPIPKILPPGQCYKSTFHPSNWCWESVPVWNIPASALPPPPSAINVPYSTFMTFSSWHNWFQDWALESHRFSMRPSGCKQMFFHWATDTSYDWNVYWRNCIWKKNHMMKMKTQDL